MSSSVMIGADLARYRQPTEGELAFVREQIILSDGRTVGEAMADDEWLGHDLLRPVFERDEAGLPRHRLCYLELPRGHWKSGGAAAVAVVEAVLHRSTDVVVAAADHDQARIVGEAIDGYLARNKLLRDSFRGKIDQWKVPARDSRIRVISSDVASSWGLGGTHKRFRVIADELTAWPDGKGEGFWTSLASATGKVADAQTIVLSNAGHDPERSWQWKVRAAAEREPWAHLYTAQGIQASWIKPAWIEQMKVLLPPLAFERVIENRWVTGTGDFVTEEQWRRCVDERLTPKTKGSGTFYGGLDLGLTKDRTALVVVHRDGDVVVLDELQVFTPTKGNPVSPASVERAVLDVAERFPRIEILADPYQLEGALERLKAAGVKIEKHVFSQGSVQKLSTSLYGAITSTTLRVFPDIELEREILGLRVVTTPSGWKFDHRAGGFSDRAVSLAMALQLAVERGAKPVVPMGVVFWHPPVRGTQIHEGGSTELLPGQKITEAEARRKNPGWRDPRYD